LRVKYGSTVLDRAVVRGLERWLVSLSINPPKATR
jgi:hypothetical protein